MISQAYEFRCDTCDETAYYIYTNRYSAKQEAKADGWKLKRDNHCFCSEECFMKWWMERNGGLCE